MKQKKKNNKNNKKLHIDKRMIGIGGLIAVTTLTQVGCGTNTSLYAAISEEPTEDPGYAVEIYGPKPPELDYDNTEEVTEDVTEEKATEEVTDERTEEIIQEEGENTTLYGVIPYNEENENSEEITSEEDTTEENETEEVTEERTESLIQEEELHTILYGPMQKNDD